MDSDIPSQSLTLPDHLIETARRVGYKWPNCDEWLFGFYAKQWASLGTICSNLHDIPGTAVRSALQKNEGEFIEAFGDFWNGRVHDNSEWAHFASGEIALRLSEAGGFLATEKNTALNMLGKVHDFLNRPTLPLLPFGISFDDQNAKAADDAIISRVHEKLADLKMSTTTQLERIARQLDDAQQKLAEATGAMQADRMKLRGAV